MFDLAGAGYILGGLLFGIALFRTRVLARWAAALLAVSTVATAALAVLPESFNRPLAVPEGIALIGLGVSLWRNPRDSGRDASETAAGRHPAPSASSPPDDHPAAGRPPSELAGPGRADGAVRLSRSRPARSGSSSSPADPP